MSDGSIPLHVLIAVAGAELLIAVGVLALLRRRAAISIHSPSVTTALVAATGIGIVAVAVGTSLSPLGVISFLRPTPSKEEFERLMAEFNALNARCNEEIKTYEQHRVLALTQIPEAKQALDTH